MPFRHHHRLPNRDIQVMMNWLLKHRYGHKVSTAQTTWTTDLWTRLYCRWLRYHLKEGQGKEGKGQEDHHRTMSLKRLNPRVQWE